MKIFKLLVIFFVWNLIGLFCSVGFGIVSFEIAINNWDTNCDSHLVSFPLPIWLLVIGSITLVYSLSQIVMMIGILSSYCIKKWLIWFFLMPQFLSIILYCMFLISWMIVGAILLFIDGFTCRNEVESLWVMSLVMFIFGCIQLLSIGCLGTSTKISKQLFLDN